MHTCKRCGYNTGRLSNIKNHLNRKKICEAILQNISIEQLKKELNAPKCSKMLRDCSKMTPKCSGISPDVRNFECGYCEKQFTRNANLKRHLSGRCAKKKELDEKERLKKEKEQEKKILNLKIKEMQKNMDILTKQLAKRDKQLDKLIEKPPTNTTTYNYKIENQQNVNNRIENMQSLTIEDMKDASAFLTEDHIRKGIEGYSQYAINHPLKDKLICTDYARKKVVFKNEDGDVVRDPNMDKSLQMFGESIEEKNSELIDNMRIELQHQIKEILNDDDEDNDIAFKKTEEIMKTIQKLTDYHNSIRQLAGEPVDDDDINAKIAEFKDELRLKLCSVSS